MFRAFQVFVYGNGGVTMNLFLVFAGLVVSLRNIQTTYLNPREKLKDMILTAWLG